MISDLSFCTALRIICCWFILVDFVCLYVCFWQQAGELSTLSWQSTDLSPIDLPDVSAGRSECNCGSKQRDVGHSVTRSMCCAGKIEPVSLETCIKAYIIRTSHTS